MKILLVDDMETRHRAFRQALAPAMGHTLVQAFDYQSAVCALLGPTKFDVALLDHDLSLASIMCDPVACTEKTGTDLANWIVANMVTQGAPRFVLHSMNPLGVRSMFNTLTSAGYTVRALRFDLLLANLGAGHLP